VAILQIYCGLHRCCCISESGHRNFDYLPFSGNSGLTANSICNSSI
jgi:hypothetical protein